jgi:unsaturated chondroitin disaccharide hydrolase
MRIRSDLHPKDLLPRIQEMWALSAVKIRSIEETCPPGTASPVFTIQGQYTARGWTEWTQGFQYGASVLQFDATGDKAFLELGRSRTFNVMAPHVTHIGVHDHGFNNVSTYGSLWRLAGEGRIDASRGEIEAYIMALKCSGAVQASRWTSIPDGGFIHSFNGPHSLFVDTVRSLRALAIAHQLGHALLGERDAKHNLLGRVLHHAHATAKYNVFYGEGRDSYDLAGRTAHESLFDVVDGSFRCPSSQQGYSPFTTWTRGLAWAMLGFSELLEWFDALPDSDFAAFGGRAACLGPIERGARVTSDFYIDQAAAQDGIPYWDTGAPGMASLGDWRARPAEVYNALEPVDSSAAAIACQGLLRLGRRISKQKGEVDKATGQRYTQAGLTVLARLLDPLYLSESKTHQGLLLHSVYHRPNNWDHIPAGQKIPCGEACQWGDYHLREVSLLVQRMAEDRDLAFFHGPIGRTYTV